MKICPYCGCGNADDAFRCKQCKAGFPAEEKILSEDTKTNSETGESTKRNGESIRRANNRKRSE